MLNEDPAPNQNTSVAPLRLPLPFQVVGGTRDEDVVKTTSNQPGHGPSSNGKSVAYLKYLKPTLGDGGDGESVSLLATQTDPSLGYRDLATLLADIKEHVLANRIRYEGAYTIGLLY